MNGKHYAVQSGKDAKLRIIDLDNLSGQGGPGHLGGEKSKIDVPQGGQVLTHPVVWRAPNNDIWMYVCNDGGVSALKLNATGDGWVPGAGGGNAQWKDLRRCSSPTMANGVLYAADNAYIRAYNPTTGQILWSNTEIGSIHWETPIVVNGVLYITDESAHLTAYTLPQTPNRPDTIGVYASGTFFLRNSNTTGFADITVPYNPSGVLTSRLRPVTGDWNNDGIDTLGVYDTQIGVFYLRNSNTPGGADYTFVMGNPGDLPLAGHWDGTMTGDGVGVYRPSNGLLYIKHALTTGFADYTMVLGNPSDYGIAGDWDGNGFDSVGVFRPSSGVFFLSNAMAGTTGIPAIVFSDYNFSFGSPTDVPFAGDWIGAGASRAGVFRNGLVFLRNSLTTGPADEAFTYGSAGALPVAGKWTAGPQPGPRTAPDVIVPVAPGTLPTRTPTSIAPPSDGQGQLD